MLTKACLVVLLCTIAIVHTEREQFYGGSLTYTLLTREGSKPLVHLEMITGWVLGKGPCGTNCTKADIGRSTKISRQQMLTQQKDESWFGSFNADYLQHGVTQTDDIYYTVTANYSEHVIAMSETAEWEQVKFVSVFEVMYDFDFDVNYDGHSWRRLALQAAQQSKVDPANWYWHFQVKITTRNRSDTGQPNRCPRSVAKPFYRVKLGEVTTLRIPTVDADGDYVKCQLAEYVEGGSIATYPPPYVTVSEDCTVSINASELNGYKNDTWIGIPVSVRDYSKEKITYGTEIMTSQFSLSQMSVQFLVQVLANLSTPQFVDPTLEGNHNFILYADTTWRTQVYAQAALNTTIEGFTAYGIQDEVIKLTLPPVLDVHRPQVKYTTMSWTPSESEVGRHIVCVQANDDTGVDSAEMRCFTLDVKSDIFNHTTKITPGKPYFIDIPSPEQFVSCRIQATCVVPLYVKGDAKIVEVSIVSTDLDERHFGPLELVTHNGDQVYKSDLFFQHSMHGKEDVCLKAKDENGVESEVVCINSRIEPPDPCVSAPCKNGGTCQRDEDTGGFKCLCMKKSSGNLCERREDPCNPDPCEKNNTVICAGLPTMLCYCKPGWTKDCTKSIEDCPKENTCSGHGTCTDKHLGYECNCLSRYTGKDCETNSCPSEDPAVTICPVDGCSPDPCNGHGVCSKGGVCTCSSGYSGDKCQTANCDLGPSNAVEFVSPTLSDRSQWTCYTDGTTINACTLRIYLTSNTGSPSGLSVTVDTTKPLTGITSVGNVNTASDIPGTQHLFTADVIINGFMNSTGQHYICVTAASGAMNTTRCFEMNFIENPFTNPKSPRYQQKDASIKFVDPTLKDQARMLCKTGDKCSVLLYTTFASTRSTCKPSGVSSGSTSGGCDQYDRDNDADDLDTAAKSSDPCCANVASTTQEVTVYHAHPRGQSCVSEASFTFATPGEKIVCFQSAGNGSQQICYTVGVFDPNTDPCSSSPCQNNGKCFHDGHNKPKCICPENYERADCSRGPCQQADNSCLNDAYCLTDNGTNTCLCKAGFSGPNCGDGPSSKSNTDAVFTDTAKPTILQCVQFQTCSLSLLLSGKASYLPAVSLGYFSSSLIVENLETVERSSVPGSYQTNVRIKAKELGMQDLCIQLKDAQKVNKDEVCFKVNVVADVVSVYSFKDRPHFVDPSLPTESRVECSEESTCHVLYYVTPGDGNEHECIVVEPKKPTISTLHVYSSCDKCTRGVSTTGNCSVDVSVVNGQVDVGTVKHVCLSLRLQGTDVVGEERCFNLSVVSKTDAAVKSGCQRLECKNGGFCDGHIPDNPVCFCPSGYDGKQCERKANGSSISVTQKQTFLGDLSLPSEVKCVVSEDCYIPFQVTTKPGVTPIVTLGFNSPHLMADKPEIKPQSGSSVVYKGVVKATPKKIGTYKVCLQANDGSTTETEVCVDVDVTANGADKIDKNQPYFLPPTVSAGSTVLCEASKACHLDVHFTKGDAFGFSGTCPTVTETSSVPVGGLHIFDAEMQAGDCTSDIYYRTNSSGEQNLCVQVSLPGKRGESRCITVKTVSDIHKEVETPCDGKKCENGGKCLADLSTSPGKYSCVCSPGFTGSECSIGVNKTTYLPGVANLNGTTGGIPHFDGHGAIPTDLKCFVSQPCCVNIPFIGDKDKPPLNGYSSPSLEMMSQQILTQDPTKTDLHLLQKCFKANETNTHRLCVQTTSNGTNAGINIDEVCIEVRTETGGSSPPPTLDPRFNNTIPEGSTVVCPTNLVCHHTIVTNKNTNGSCSQARECESGINGVHVFETKEIGGYCFTDLAIKTESTGRSNLCVSAGKGGEERQILIHTEDKQEFGPCQKLHCSNGGTCLSVSSSNATCVCIPGFTGKHCEINIDECKPNPCEHNGTCTDLLNNYTCACVLGFTGRNCEQNINDCATNPCAHGNCTDLVNDYNCMCIIGYTGKNCSEDIDDCSKNPCVHGTCTDLVNDYTCTCMVGYTGKNCSEDIDDCNPNPCVNGNCTDLVNDYNCGCVLGYTDKNCSTNIDDCARHPCIHGSCTDMVNDYKCTCAAGYTGKNCDTALPTSSTPTTTAPTTVTTKSTTDTSTTSPTTTSTKPTSTSTATSTSTSPPTTQTTVTSTLSATTGTTKQPTSSSIASSPPTKQTTVTSTLSATTGTTKQPTSSSIASSPPTTQTPVTSTLSATTGTTKQPTSSSIASTTASTTASTIVSTLPSTTTTIISTIASTKPTTTDPTTKQTLTTTTSATTKLSPTTASPTTPKTTKTTTIASTSAATTASTTASTPPSTTTKRRTTVATTKSATTESTTKQKSTTATSLSTTLLSMTANPTTPKTIKTTTIASTTAAATPPIDVASTKSTTTEPTTKQTTHPSTVASTTTTTTIPTTSAKPTLAVTASRSTVLSSTSKSTTRPTTTTTTTKATTEKTTTSLASTSPTTSQPGNCGCHNGTCVNGACICAQGWSGNKCNIIGGTETHPGIKVATNPVPPVFTELVIPQIIPCKVNTFCAIILPVVGKLNTSPSVEHGDIDPGLEDSINVKPKDGGQCNPPQNLCPYEATISVKPSAIKLYKYCVLTKDYQRVNVDELCYQIQGVPDETTQTSLTGFVYPPTLPENSTMECPHSSTCHYQLEIKKNGTCEKKLAVQPDDATVVFVSSEDKTSTCKYEVAYTPSSSMSGKHTICFSPQASSATKHCMNVNVTNSLNFQKPAHCQDGDPKQAREEAEEIVRTGYASCFCIVNQKKVHIIKKRPVVPNAKLFKAAGFGAGGMVGAMVVGVVIYAVVNKLRQPPEIPDRRNPPTPRQRHRMGTVHPKLSR